MDPKWGDSQQIPHTEWTPAEAKTWGWGKEFEALEKEQKLLQKLGDQSPSHGWRMGFE